MFMGIGAHGGQTPFYHTVSYQMNNGNPWKDLKFPNREDFDYSWNYVYASYSYETA